MDKKKKTNPLNYTFPSPVQQYKSWISTTNTHYIGTPYTTNSPFVKTSNLGLGLRSDLFLVEIGEYKTEIISSLIRGINFEENRIIISFLLDEKDVVREAFTEYHFFRLSYLDTNGKTIEKYEIRTDPLIQVKHVLPNVGHGSTEIPIWKLIWDSYNIIKL
jgi:hypothetical protein